MVPKVSSIGNEVSVGHQESAEGVLGMQNTKETLAGPVEHVKTTGSPEH